MPCLCLNIHRELLNVCELPPCAANVPDLPWCPCWTSLEPTYELDPKSTQHMRNIVRDFELENFESCLRRVDNLVLSRGRRKGKNAEDHVLVELAALCNRFAVRLFFLGRVEHSHAFFDRVMRFTNNSTTSNFAGKAELFGWTCDLVGYCLCNQKKFEQSHWTLTRAAPANTPFNSNVVSRLHATQMLVKLDKPDLVIALGSKVLVELMQARFEHQVALFCGLPPPNSNQILKIVEHLDERGHQTASPSYVNLLCHQAETICFALARNGRYTSPSFCLVYCMHRCDQCHPCMRRWLDMLRSQHISDIECTKEWHL